ncbi:MAG: hypothetical protein Q9199_005153 [Rusavskia elegans]
MATGRTYGQWDGTKAMADKVGLGSMMDIYRRPRFRPAGRVLASCKAAKDCPPLFGLGQRFPRAGRQSTLSQSSDESSHMVKLYRQISLGKGLDSSMAILAPDDWYFDPRTRGTSDVK